MSLVIEGELGSLLMSREIHVKKSSSEKGGLFRTAVIQKGWGVGSPEADRLIPR